MADESPTSFGQALAQAHEPAAAPSGETLANSPDPNAAGSSPANDTVSQPETADPSAAAPTTPPTAQGTPGEPPQERWPDILSNARKKERAAVEAEFSQRFGWVPQGVTPEQGQAIIARAMRQAHDPVGEVVERLAELNQHPEYSAQLRSHAARTLASGRQAAQDVEPPPDVDLGEGAPKLRSAENQAQWAAWFKRQLLGEVNQSVQPLVQEREQRQQAEQQAEQQRVTHERARQTFGKLEKKADFAAIRPAVAKLFAERVSQGFPDEQTGEVALECYTEVWFRDIYPTLDARSRSAALHALNEKARGTTQNPASPAPQSMRAPRSMEDALRMAHEGR